MGNARNIPILTILKNYIPPPPPLRRDAGKAEDSNDLHQHFKSFLPSGTSLCFTILRLNDMKRYGKQRSSRVAWDEANLNFLEATKTPKRKITEPKTPYHAPDGFVSPFAREDTLDNAEHAQAVWNALSDISSSSGETSTSRTQEDWASYEDEDLDESTNFEDGWSQNDHRSKFAERRKAHYDEYRTLKSLRKEDLVVNDAEEDDEMQINGEEDMITDGIHLVHLHDDRSTSGGSKSNPGKKPQA